MGLRFEQGPSPYTHLKLTQSNYTGIIYVPNGYTARVTGSGSDNHFTVSKELKGRVIDSMTGSNNHWAQEK